MSDFDAYEPYRVKQEAWHEYVKDYLAKRRVERSRGYPDCIYPSDQDVEEVLLKAATFTLSRPSYPFLTVLDESQTVPVEESAGENPIQ